MKCALLEAGSPVESMFMDVSLGWAVCQDFSGLGNEF